MPRRRTCSRHSLVKRSASWLAVALLGLGYPGPGVAWAASQQLPAAAGCGLSVATVPAGAAVYVDGELQGSTPVQLADLSAGDHRVRVVKQGYLENSRVVGLRSGVARSLSLQLTPDVRYGTAAAVQVEDYEPEEEEGGGNKLLLLGLGAVAVGAGAFLLLRSTNNPPTAGSVTVSPTGTGMAGQTEFTFTAQGASDPDGDSLTYSWDFGDGASGSGQSSRHTYSTTGSFTASVTVSDGEESATASGRVTVERDLAGTWSGGRIVRILNPVSLDLTQSGTTLGGNMILGSTPNSTGGTRPLSGTAGPLSYPTDLSWSSDFFGLNVRFNGTVDAGGNTMTGTITGNGLGFSSSGSTTFSR